MSTAVLLFSLLAAVAAEAPYNLPRPGPNAPSINYQTQGNPQQYPLQPGQFPSYQYQYPNTQGQQNYMQGPGYQFQQHNFGQLPGYRPPQVQVNQQQPIFQQPNSVYGSPFLRQAPQQAVPLPALAPGFNQQAFPVQQGISQYPQGYSNQNGFSSFGAQAIGQSPLAYNNHPSSYSSYQADSNAYTANQINREPLDSTVVDRIQNIIADNEINSARSAGYISLVTGVELERARPSLELSSFVQNSRIRNQGSGPSLQDLARGSIGRSNSGAVGVGGSPSSRYGVPIITANSAQGGQGQTGISFLPQSQASNSYGLPN